MLFSLSSTPWFYSRCHHGLLTCKSCNMNSLGLSGTSASLGNDMDPGPISYRFRTIVLLLVTNLAFLFPCIVRMLYIHSYGVLLSCMWYTKRILVCPYFCSGLARTLSSSNPSSSLRWLDLSSDIGFLLVAGLPSEPLPASGTFVIVVDILSVVILNWKTCACVAYLS
jgi:hypothetical protein